eukprot:378653-Amphidinium_carterae.1
MPAQWALVGFRIESKRQENTFNSRREHVQEDVSTEHQHQDPSIARTAQAPRSHSSGSGSRRERWAGITGWPAFWAPKEVQERKRELSTD